MAESERLRGKKGHLLCSCRSASETCSMKLLSIITKVPGRVQEERWQECLTKMVCHSAGTEVFFLFCSEHLSMHSLTEDIQRYHAPKIGCLEQAHNFILQVLPAEI